MAWVVASMMYVCIKIPGPSIDFIAESVVTIKRKSSIRSTRFRSCVFRGDGVTRFVTYDHGLHVPAYCAWIINRINRPDLQLFQYLQVTHLYRSRLAISQILHKPKTRSASCPYRVLHQSSVLANLHHISTVREALAWFQSIALVADQYIPRALFLLCRPPRTL